MQSRVQKLRKNTNSICLLGKGSVFRNLQSLGRTMISRGEFWANLFTPRVIYRIFGRGYAFTPSSFISFPRTPLSFSYPSTMSEVAESRYESILTSDS